MKKKSFLALVMICCFVFALADPVRAEQPIADDVYLTYNFETHELTVNVRQCRQVLCQISENYVTQIVVYKVATPSNILVEERNYPKMNYTWGMQATFQVDAIEGEELEVQVAMNDLEDFEWPILNKTILLSESTPTTSTPYTVPSAPAQIPIDTILLMGFVGGTILVVVVVFDRALFRKTG